MAAAAAADNIKSIKCDAAEEMLIVVSGEDIWIVMWGGCGIDQGMREIEEMKKWVWYTFLEEVIFGSVLKKVQKNNSKSIFKLQSAVLCALNFHKNQQFIINIAFRHIFYIIFESLVTF
jgi:hypothetical protein